MRERIRVETPPMPYGRAYYRWCRVVNLRFGPKEETIKRAQAKRAESFRKAQGRFREASRTFLEVEFRYPRTDRSYEKGQRDYERARKRFEAAKRKFERPSFVEATRFLGWPLQYHEVLFFAALTTVFVFVPALLLFVVWAVFATPEATSLLAFAPVVVLALPVGLFVFLATFPEKLAKSVRVYSLGKSPEAVSYLAMSMRLAPSLNRAVGFAAENCEEPVASALEKVSWDVYLRRYPSVEESFLQMAHEWGKWNDDLRRSFHTIRSAALEPTTEGLDRVLEKAKDIILTGTKAKIEHFVAGLNGPTTVLFALGVLLPMTVGATLPLVSTNLSIPTFGDTEGGRPGLPEPLDPAPIALLMNIIFPFVAFAYAYSTLGRRPGTASPPDVPQRLSHRRITTARIIALAVTISLVSVGVVSLTTLAAQPPSNPSAPELIHMAIGPLPILWGLAFGASYYLLTTTRRQKKERDEILELENEFPDGLFQLGSRIAEGNAQERAIEMSARTLEGTKVAELFTRMAHRMKVSRTTLENVLFGEEGLLREYPSRMIRAAMRVLVEVAEKDSQSAGKTLIGVSTYLKDMKKIDQDIRTSLKASADNMKATGVIFAPIVLGVTVALYGFLFTVFSGLGDIIPTAMIPVPQFQLIMGIFLVLMVVLIMYYVSGIEWGEDWVERKYLIGTAMPVAVFLFTIVVIGARSFFGG